VLQSLPSYTTPFVGRTTERAAAHDALAAHPLVTLTGPGGVGKTRLAAVVAAHRRGEVVFCRLETARQATDVCALLARALELPLDRREVAEPGRAIEVELAARGALLVVLDTVEQLRPVMEGLLARWRAAAPEVRWLLTSRWPLRLPGEVVVALSPLGAEGSHLLRALSPVALPEDPETTAEIARIVHQLDGLPLAIELAAARLEVLSLPHLAHRLAERFAVLRDPERADERHGTLWNTVAWSWALLAPWEQEALLQLAVFEGGFTLAAAEAVVRPPDGRPTLDAIHTLLRKALISLQESDGTTQVAARYALPATIRAFALTKLAESGGQVAVEARHTAWCLTLDPDQPEILASELPELRAVLQRALATHPATAQSAQEALRAVRALLGLLHARLPASDAESLLQAALEHAAPWPSPLTAEVRRQRARALRYVGRMSEALSELDRAEAAGQDDPLLCARISNTRAELQCLDHQLKASLESAFTALARHRALGNRHGEGVSEAQIGLVYSFQGDLRTARERWQAARVLLEGSGDRFYQAVVLGHLASLALETGDLASAREYTEQALALHQQLGNRRSAAICQGYRALCHHHTGEREAARAEYQAVIAALDRVGEVRFAACYRFYDALLDLEQGHAPADALAAVDAQLSALGERRYLALTRCARAALAIRQGAHAEAELAQVKAELKAVADPLLTPVYGLPQAAALLARGAARSEILFQSEMMDQVAGDDARLAARVVRAWVAAADAEAHAWHIAADGRWFQPPAGERVELAHRVPLTRLLAALLAQPGLEVPREALIAAGWPGERLLPDAAGNRLRVGLSTLRSLGLGDLIERTEHGYRLDPAVPVRIDP